MPDSNTPTTQSSSEDYTASLSNTVYEATLAKAFNKLTSEIFIFLLAYVILLIGLAVYGPQLASTLRNLLYILPMLGVLAYVWLQEQGIVKAAKAQGIDVTAGIVIGSAKVSGVRGAKPDSILPENVQVGVGLAGGNAEVGGVVYDDTEPKTSQNSSLEVLVDIYKQLNKSNKIKLIARAQQLLDKE